MLSVVSTNTPTTVNVPEKIKYAKWKAADIAKAFREGRKPKPGAANEPEPSEIEQTQVGTTGQEFMGEETLPLPSIHRATSPPPQIPELRPSPPSTPEHQHVLPHGFADPKAGPLSPGSWSTAATPGSPLKKVWVGEEEGSDEEYGGGPGMGTHVGLGGVNPEQGQEQAQDEIHLPSRPLSEGRSSTGPKKVHFTPSVTGGLTPSTTHPDEDDPFVSIPPIPSAEFTPSAPPFEGEADKPLSLPNAPPTIPFLPPHSPTAFNPPSLPPPPPSFPSQLPHAPPAPFIPQRPVAETITSDYTNSTITQTPEELTPQLVTRVQRHCKFAISALDYEDAEQARKELRAALKMLGG